MRFDTFAAIDFETCMRKRASPIQIGVVRVIDGVVGTPFTERVMPPEGFRHFEKVCTDVHGLTPAYIQGAPEWPEILARLVRFADGLPLVAHNASFERSVINQTSEALGLATPAFSYVCTLKMARAVDPAGPGGPANHKLDTLARRYGITQEHHHDAGDDARVGAELALELLRRDSAGGTAWRRAWLR